MTSTRTTKVAGDGQGANRRADGRRTRTLLMDAAEELFATHGVEGVSIRSVNAAAGLAPASVHYHFGDRDGLVRAVITRRGDQMIRRQAELLDVVERLEPHPTGRDAVLLLAEPLFEMLQDDPVGGRRWITVVANLVVAHDDRVYQESGPGSVGDRINACAAAAYPNRDAAFVADRWRLASMSLLQLLAGSADALGGDPAIATEAFDSIVTFVAAGLDGVCGPTAVSASATGWTG